jgi:polyhydroxybutyrate depolymerase
VDDVSFISQLLDEIGKIGNVDSKRTYACGLSNGGMMCYRLASELSNKIAAIGPVGGTMPNTDQKPQRPVSVIHFHGTLDKLVPYDVGEKNPAKFLRLKSVEQSIEAWLKLDGCPDAPASTDVLSKDGDELKVVRQIYGPGTDGAEVVLVTIEGGGHTWPGQVPPVKFLGKSALNISANDLIWEFFEKHPMK